LRPGDGGEAADGPSRLCALVAPEADVQAVGEVTPVLAEEAGEDLLGAAGQRLSQ
jgi:hypothetical protein